MFILSLCLFSPILCVLSCFLGHSPFFDLFLEHLFFPCFFFCCPFLIVSLFLWRFSLIWLYFSCLFFSFCILSFLFNNHVFLLNRVCCLLFFWKKSFLLLPVFFTSSEKALSLGVCVDSFWNFRFWTLHIHLHHFNIFPRMSTLPLYSLLLFILFPLVLSFVSPCFLAIFNFLFFLVLDCLFNFFFCFLLFTKTILFVSFFCWTCFTFIFPALYCFSVSWEMVSRFLS